MQPFDQPRRGQTAADARTKTQSRRMHALKAASLPSSIAVRADMHLRAMLFDPRRNTPSAWTQSLISLRAPSLISHVAYRAEKLDSPPAKMLPST